MPQQPDDHEPVLGETTMQEFSFKALILGFIAGAIATLTVHELIKSLFFDAGIIQMQPWDLTPVEGGSVTSALPKIGYATLWGGLWGALMGAIFGRHPEGSMTCRGALFGIIGPAVLGTFLFAPLLEGTAPFMGGNLNAIGAVIAMLAGWGAVTAWLLGLFSYGRLP